MFVTDLPVTQKYDPQQLSQLRTSLTGQVITSEEAGYDLRTIARSNQNKS